MSAAAICNVVNDVEAYRSMDVIKNNSPTTLQRCVVSGSMAKYSNAARLSTSCQTIGCCQLRVNEKKILRIFDNLRGDV